MITKTYHVRYAIIDSLCEIITSNEIKGIEHKLIGKKTGSEQGTLWHWVDRLSNVQQKTTIHEREFKLQHLLIHRLRELALNQHGNSSLAIVSSVMEMLDFLKEKYKKLLIQIPSITSLIKEVNQAMEAVRPMQMPPNLSIMHSHLVRNKSDSFLFAQSKQTIFVMPLKEIEKPSPIIKEEKERKQEPPISASKLQM